MVTSTRRWRQSRRMGCLVAVECFNGRRECVECRRDAPSKLAASTTAGELILNHCAILGQFIPGTALPV